MAYEFIVCRHTIRVALFAEVRRGPDTESGPFASFVAFGSGELLFLVTIEHFGRPFPILTNIISFFDGIVNVHPAEMTRG